MSAPHDTKHIIRACVSCDTAGAYDTNNTGAYAPHGHPPFRGVVCVAPEPVGTVVKSTH